MTTNENCENSNRSLHQIIWQYHCRTLTMCDITLAEKLLSENLEAQEILRCCQAADGYYASIDGKLEGSMAKMRLKTLLLTAKAQIQTPIANQTNPQQTAKIVVMIDFLKEVKSRLSKMAACLGTNECIKFAEIECLTDVALIRIRVEVSNEIVVCFIRLSNVTENLTEFTLCIERMHNGQLVSIPNFFQHKSPEQVHRLLVGKVHRDEIWQISLQPTFINDLEA